MMYRMFKFDVGEIVQRQDGAAIPPDPANTDYQAFLAWVAEGNQPEIIE